VVVSSNNHGSIDMEWHRVNLTVQKVAMALEKEGESARTGAFSVDCSAPRVRTQKYDEAMYIAHHARVQMHLKQSLSFVLMC